MKPSWYIPPGPDELAKTLETIRAAARAECPQDDDAIMHTSIEEMLMMRNRVLVRVYAGNVDLIPTYISLTDIVCRMRGLYAATKAEVRHSGGVIPIEPFDYAQAIAPITPARPEPDREPSGEGEGHSDGAPVGEDVHGG